MSALAFLSGLSQAAGDQYAQIQKEKRENKFRQNELLADSIHKRLETDDTLNWDAYSNLRQQEYELRGVDKSHIPQILQHEKSVWDQAQRNRPQQPGTPALPAIPQAPGPTGINPETSATTQIPGASSAPQVSAGALPPMPQAPETLTTGNLRYGAQASGQMQLAEAAIQKQRELLDLYNQQDQATAQNSSEQGGVEAEPTPHLKHRRSIGTQGISMTQEYEQPKIVPQVVYGEDVLKQFPNAPGVSPTGWYRKGLFSDGSVRHYPTQPQVAQKVVYDPESPTLASYVRTDPRGNVVGEPQRGAPSNLLPKTTQSETIQKYTDPNDAQLKWKVIPRSTTITPRIGGQAPAPGVQAPTGTGPQPLPAIPTPSQAARGGKATASTVPTKEGSFNPVKPFDPTDPVDYAVALMGKDSKSGQLAVNKLSKPNQIRFTQRLKDLGVEPFNATTSMRDRAIQAKTVLSHLEVIRGLIDQAEKDGDLGVLASRWNDFLSNKVGQDTTKNQIFSRLASEQGFLSTAAAMAHGGIRGGSSPTMVEHWKHTLEAKDPATIKSKLKTLEEWMKHYQDIMPSQPQVGPGYSPIGSVPSAPTSRPPLSSFER